VEEAVIQIGKDLVKTIDKVSNLEKRIKEIEMVASLGCGIYHQTVING
jgi:hypothetical protein